MTAARLARAAMLAALLSAPGTAWSQAAGEGRLPPTIPLFPLQDVMLFPDMSRPLHIFEQRYREMVTEAVQGDGLIGMVLLRPGYEADYEGNPPIFEVGCAGEIVQAEELDDGRWLILLEGTVRFRVLGEDHSRSYRVADVEALAEQNDQDDRRVLRGYREQLAEVFTAMAPSRDTPPEDVSDADLVNALSQFLPLDPQDRQALLETAGPRARAEALFELVGAPAGGPR